MATTQAPPKQGTPSEPAFITHPMPRSWVNIQKQLELDRVPKDSSLACTRCRSYRAFRCSLCPEQVCMWCHQPDVDHHNGKADNQALNYVMTDLETGAVIPHSIPDEDDCEPPLPPVTLDHETEADKTPFALWELVVNVSEALADMTDQDVQFWPEDALTTAATILMLAHSGVKQWRAQKFEECLATAHVGQQAVARLERILRKSD